MRTNFLCSLALVATLPAPLWSNDLDRDEDVILFPTFALWDESALSVAIPVRGWIFEPEDDSAWRGATLNQLCRILEIPPEDRNSAIFRERARRFLVDNERGQSLMIDVGTRAFRLSTSTADGHFASTVTLPREEVAAIINRPPAGTAEVSYSIQTPHDDQRTFIGRVHLIEPDGWSVISDIDDTIKRSNVLDKRELMKNTFLREFVAVEGMAGLYREWGKTGAAFHYVSGSPWQLYPALDEFAETEGFPRGTFHLREFRFKDRSSIELLKSPQDYKLRTITTILRAYPRRSFVLVGDSGEQDPEVYGELARRQPRQIAHIAIRNITKETLAGERMKAAFRNVAPERVTLFEQAKELKSLPAPPSNKG